MDTCQSILKDPRTATARLNIDPVLRTFVCCPSCRNIYPYVPGEHRPSRCTNVRLDSTACDTLLWRDTVVHGRATLRPIGIYQHQDFMHWLGRLLSRKGVEDLFDSYPAGLHSSPHEISDIWLGDVLLNLKDHEGNQFFSPTSGSGRLVFGLSLDSFEPGSSRPGHTPHSSTGIWLVCYNFPPHLRYLPENVYLAGVIPGPTKPELTDINPYIQLIVNDFLQFWRPGVFFSRTYSSPLGRSYLAALIPLICDMLGARQVAGKPAPTAHNTCTICDIDIDDIRNFDPSSWPMKHPQHLLRIAQAWRDASTEAHRTQLFEAFGQRWSPLFALPYWDPVKFIVIDSMHALDINILKGHLRHMFQIDPTRPGGDATPSVPLTHNKMHIPKLARGQLVVCKRLIERNAPDLLYKLLEIHRAVLYVVSV